MASPAASAVAALTEAGFEAAAARRALRQAGGNVDAAAEALLPGSPLGGDSSGRDGALAALEEMGFDSGQARRALAASNGQLELATEMLLARGVYTDQPRAQELGMQQAPPRRSRDDLSHSGASAMKLAIKEVSAGDAQGGEESAAAGAAGVGAQEGGDAGFCIALDGANIMREGRIGAPKEDPGQLRAAFCWFAEQLPNCHVRIFLYKGLEAQMREDRRLRDVQDHIVWTPSRTDVDGFILRVAAEGLNGRRVYIATNDCFDEYKGKKLSGVAIDDAWVRQHTIKFSIVDGAFFPDLVPPELGAGVGSAASRPRPPPLPASSFSAAAPQAGALAVEVSLPRGHGPRLALRVGAESPTTFRCLRRQQRGPAHAPGAASPCELQLRLVRAGGAGAARLELVGAGGKSVELPTPRDGSTEEVLCPTCGVFLEFRRVPPERPWPTAGPQPGGPAPAARSKFAFVATLWAPPTVLGGEGQVARYGLDAFVLGHSLACAGSRHDRVLLCTAEAEEQLRQGGWLGLLDFAGWRRQRVEPLQAADVLLSDCRPKFRGAFTKLRALGLVEYERVALVDVDMLARQSADDLADGGQFPAPMAVARVSGRTQELQPGDEIRGKDLFNDDGRQRYGINAGVVVLDTCAEELQRMEACIQDGGDRSHVPTRGPEQDFLSRWPGYLDQWRQLDPRYNFQLHQLGLMSQAGLSDRRDVPYEEARLLHFSSEPKPSDYFFQAHRDGLSELSFDEFVTGRLLPDGAEEWVHKTIRRAALDWREAFDRAWQAAAEAGEDGLQGAGGWQRLLGSTTLLPHAERIGAAAAADADGARGWLLRPGAAGLAERVQLLAAALRHPAEAAGAGVTRTEAGQALLPSAASDLAEDQVAVAVPRAAAPPPEPPRRLRPVRDKTLVDQHREMVLAAMERHRVVIIVSSTGSGKSTAVPRLIVEECEKARVACTQPRRIAAVSLARRVAKLWGTRVGDEVGYQIGGCSMIEDASMVRLVFMTAATAMLQLLQSGFQFSHLVIDEVHERSIFIDILLTIVKTELLPACRGLKVILMSAAMDSARLQKYFADGGMEPCLLNVDVPQLHKVETWTLDQIDFFKGQPVPVHEVTNLLLAEFVLHLHKADESYTKHTFLVFLAGKPDVQEIYERLIAASEQIELKPIYGGMSIESQERILRPNLRGSGCRTVILATDVIESSVTIPDVTVVIDTLLHKRRRWDPAKRESPLTLEHVSVDEAKQRAGRTGRTGPGFVFRLLTECRFASLRRHAEPQISSDRLEDTLLTLYEQQAIPDPRVFLQQMPDPPETVRVDRCIIRFLELNAMEKRHDTGRPQPTHFGRFLKLLPLDPEVGNLVMNGIRYGIVDNCVTVAAVHQRGEPFIEDPTMTMKQAQELMKVRSACSGTLPSDLIAGLMGYRAWRRKLDEMNAASWDVADEAAWCSAHFLSLSKLHEVEELRTQIFDALRENGYHEGVCDGEKALMRRRRRQKDRLNANGQRASEAPGEAQGAAEELRHLLRPEHEDLDKRRLLHWCLAAAFLHGVLECENLDHVHEVKFELWETGRPEQAPEQSQFLQTFLRWHGFLVQSFRVGRRGDVFVKFQTQQHARLALQVCSLVGTDKKVPFRRCSRWGPKDDAIRCRAWCGAAECKIAGNSLAALPEQRQVTVVAAEFLPIERKGKKSMFYLCTKCSVVPRGILPLVVLATYHAAELEDHGDSLTVRARFFGTQEELQFTKPPDAEVVQLVREIRKGMDAEFRLPSGPLPPDQCRGLVMARQDQVLNLMRRLEAESPLFAARQDQFGLQPRVCVHHWGSLRDLSVPLGDGDFDLDAPGYLDAS